MKKVLLFLCAIFFTTGAGSTGIGVNDTTASCDNDTLGQTSGTASMEVDWQPNTIDISWYSDNVLLSVQSSAQSCIYDEDLYLPAQPTKTGYTFKGWTVRGVPSGYTRLEYIQATGTQYIDTGIKQDTTDFYVNLGVAFGEPGIRYLFGVSRTSPMYFGRAENTTFEMNQKFTSLKSQTNQRVDFKWGKNSGSSTMKLIATVDGQSETLVSTASAFVEGNNFIFFANNLGSSIWPDSQLKGYLYYLQIYKHNVLVSDLVPVKRDSDSAVGMYDIVSETFKTNAGSGTFIAGPVVH